MNEVIEKNVKQSKEKRKESIRYNKLCLLVHNVFNNKDGELLLQKLENMFIKQPVAYHEWSSNKAYFREGENNAIRAIFAMNKFGQNLLGRSIRA